MDLKSLWTSPVFALMPAYTLRYTFYLIPEIPPNPWRSEWIRITSLQNADPDQPSLSHALGFKVVAVWWSDLQISTKILWYSTGASPTGGMIDLGKSTGVSGCTQHGGGKRIHILPAFDRIQLIHEYSAPGLDEYGEGVFTLYARVR